MGFSASYDTEYKLWDFIMGNEYINYEVYDGIYNNGGYGLSIDTNRFFYLQELSQMNDGIKVAFRDPQTDFWTKWLPFPGGIMRTYNKVAAPVVDVHRSILDNEIVIESDYPTYEENYEAAKIIGAILEHKGFTPHYYYSGSKSVHIHVFLDWSILSAVFLDEETGEIKEIGDSIYSLPNFKKNFIAWLRKKMISCWDMNIREFDGEFIRASHLIRAELSRNKKGFKTFLGYKYQDMSFIPSICNEENRIYPRLGEVRLSQPHCIKELIDDFLENKDENSRVRKIQKKNKPLSRFDNNYDSKEIRGCVKAILSDDFVKSKDGLKRGMFILTNELRRCLGDESAATSVNDWNARMGNPLKQAEIDYRFKTKNYTLSCNHIHSFLDEIGVKVVEKCQHKLYK